jgi:hypothetical protein
MRPAGSASEACLSVKAPAKVQAVRTLCTVLGEDVKEAEAAVLLKQAGNSLERAINSFYDKDMPSQGTSQPPKSDKGVQPTASGQNLAVSRRPGVDAPPKKQARLSNAVKAKSQKREHSTPGKQPSIMAFMRSPDARTQSTCLTPAQAHKPSGVVAVLSPASLTEISGTVLDMSHDDQCTFKHVLPERPTKDKQTAQLKPAAPSANEDPAQTVSERKAPERAHEWKVEQRSCGEAGPFKIDDGGGEAEPFKIDDVDGEGEVEAPDARSRHLDDTPAGQQLAGVKEAPAAALTEPYTVLLPMDKCALNCMHFWWSS